jgi:3-oxoacyl-[acyl-carrier protein] reductase
MPTTFASLRVLSFLRPVRTARTFAKRGGRGFGEGQGVHGVIRDVALELAEYGINVNAVAPGPIDADRTGPALRKLNETVEYSPNHMTSLRRLGQPIEIANAVLFLASAEASYITGVTLQATGGR